MAHFFKWTLITAFLMLGASACLAEDEMGGVWKSSVGDLFVLRQGKVRTQGASGLYEGTKGYALGKPKSGLPAPLECWIELIGPDTMKGNCKGGRFIMPYEFTAQRAATK